MSVALCKTLSGAVTRQPFPSAFCDSSRQGRMTLVEQTRKMDKHDQLMQLNLPPYLDLSETPGLMQDLAIDCECERNLLLARHLLPFRCSDLPMHPLLNKYSACNFGIGGNITYQKHSERKDLHLKTGSHLSLMLPVSGMSCSCMPLIALGIPATS